MPLAWYAHHLPESFQKFSVVGTLIIQLVLPFMFFLPSRRYRLFAATVQVHPVYIVHMYDGAVLIQFAASAWMLLVVWTDKNLISSVPERFLMM